MVAAKKFATHEDLFDLKPNEVGQILFGVLHVQSRPATPDASASSALGEELGAPFRRGRGGPGGWVILDEPEVHLGADVLVPDLAGWRRERLPAPPSTAYISVSPDWVCDVLSPSTEKLDRGDKLKVYAREKVPYVWLINPETHHLEVLKLDGPTYPVLAVHTENEKIRAEPFDAIELELGHLWEW